MARQGDGKDAEVVDVIQRLMPVVERASADEIGELLELMAAEVRPGGSLLDGMRAAAERFEPRDGT